MRLLDLDKLVAIDRGSITLYPEGATPAAGRGLNKEAVISLRVPPSRAVKGNQDTAPWVARMREVTESSGNIFISYDMETWIFRVPDFDGCSGTAT